MTRWIFCFALVLTACSHGAPSGFSGDRWSVPMIGPLENGVLLVPVYVGGKGPYVFEIDPDAPISIVDDQVVREAGLRTGAGSHMLDESDTIQTRTFAEVIDWQVGTLQVRRTEQTDTLVAKQGAFDSNGRRIHGVLGRDVIADSLVFGFDRDLGIVYMSTQEQWKPPTGGVQVHYDQLTGGTRNIVTKIDHVPVSRRLAKAQVDGQPFTLHVDLGATESQLREPLWAKASLATSPAKLLLLDEVVSPREVTQTGIAQQVQLATATSSHVTFVPYADHRYADYELDGTLGLDFFRPFSVFVNWDTSTIYLRPRLELSATQTARLGRWSSEALGRCASTGCGHVMVTDPLAGKPADQLPEHHPGVVVSVARDPQAAGLDLELLIAARPAAGKPGLRWLVASLPARVDHVMTHLPADYVGAELTIVDLSPFPRSCPDQDGCIDTIAVE